MGVWIWGAMIVAIVLILAGGVAWWLGRGCVVTKIGATGAVVGGATSFVIVLLLIDSELAFRASAAITIASGAWLFAWALAGGIRGQLAERAAAEAVASSAVEPTVSHV